MLPRMEENIGILVQHRLLVGEWDSSSPSSNALFPTDLISFSPRVLEVERSSLSQTLALIFKELHLLEARWMIRIRLLYPSLSPPSSPLTPSQICDCFASSGAPTFGSDGKTVYLSFRYGGMNSLGGVMAVNVYSGEVSNLFYFNETSGLFLF